MAYCVIILLVLSTNDRHTISLSPMERSSEIWAHLQITRPPFFFYTFLIYLFFLLSPNNGPLLSFLAFDVRQFRCFRGSGGSTLFRIGMLPRSLNITATTTTKHSTTINFQYLSKPQEHNERKNLHEHQNKKKMCREINKNNSLLVFGKCRPEEWDVFKGIRYARGRVRWGGNDGVPEHYLCRSLWFGLMKIINL